MTTRQAASDQPTLFGHPTGLYTLFFAEMWERFSYYGMRALLVFYMIKGFLGYTDSEAYGVYGAYTALVYATPFIGGMLADKLLGARKAVVLGGLLMAAGHLLMTLEQEQAFFVALALLIAGNGFFKPNISTIVGSLYPEGSAKRDGGFTIFYIGINLGAAMAPLLCGYVGEKYGWHYGFGLATVGMLIGIAVFVAPVRVTQILIMLGALTTAGGMVYLQDNPYTAFVNGFVALALVLSGSVAFLALQRGGLPDEAGRPQDEAAASRKVYGLRADVWVYASLIVVVPLIAVLVSNSEIAGWMLTIFGIAALGTLAYSTFQSEKVERERMYVVFVLLFFSMLFWAFFEQAGSSVNNFTDRNVDRVIEESAITQNDVGQTLPIEMNQEQLGFTNGTERITLDVLDDARAEGQTSVDWTVAEEHVGMKLGGSEIPASVFQSANPIYILIFGLLFTALWSFLASRRLEPSTPVKFALGLLQLGLGFGALWVGAQNADARGMVAVSWLLLAYLLQTTGELCLSPVGLSMVTKLAPPRIVSTVMGAWFLATAFSNYLAGIIATFTGVEHGGGGSESAIPPPIDTVNVYGTVFGQIALTAIGSSLVCFALAPILTKWMHVEEMGTGGDGGGGDQRPTAEEEEALRA